jgi:hypothetical protein
MDTRPHRRGSTAQPDFKTAINAAVYRSITDATYQIDPPKLSPGLWDYISIQNRDNREESERLEFLGDALMDACIAIEMYRMLPGGNPHKYTVRILIYPVPSLLTFFRPGGLQRSPFKFHILSSRTQDGN